MFWGLTYKLFRQPDSVYTVQDALALISQPQSMQVEPSDPSKASQQVMVLIEMIEVLPPVLSSISSTSFTTQLRVV
jgi:hypothetical protein